MRYLLIFFSILTIPFRLSPAVAEGIYYQGTHILTYSAMNKLSKAFEKKTGLRVMVRGGGCSDGIATVRNGRAEMGGLCCPLPQRLKDKGIVAHPVAMDIKVVVVNRENPLKNISLEQLRDIHTGKITNWKELGWKDAPIALIYRRHCLDMDEPVRRALGIKDDLSNLSKKTIVVRTDMELLEYVSRFKTAVGVTSKVFAVTEDVKILDLDGVRATPLNVKNHLYRLTSPLYIITKAHPGKLTKSFLRFILSPDGQAIITGSNLGAIR